MTKKQAPKKAAKKAKVTKDRPPEGNATARAFDAAMDRIAKAPWPPKK